MWNAFYKNPRLLLLTLLLVVVWGLSALHALPRIEDPEIRQRWAMITTPFPGASADRVEQLVTNPIEQALMEIEEMDEVISTSSKGVSTIFAVLDDRVIEVDSAWADVRDRLADITSQLPAETLTPQYEPFLSKANTLIAAFTWQQDTPPNYSALIRSADELAKTLQALKGTERVEIVGAPTEEITVAVDAATLARLNLTPQTLAQQIKLSDAKVPTGQLYGDRSDLLLEVNSELDSLERLRTIPIRATTDGQSTQLGDIATITQGIRMPATDLALIKGRPAVVVAALMDSNQKIDRWSRDAKQAVADSQQQLSTHVDCSIIFDQSQYVNRRLNQLFVNLLLGGTCVLATTVVMMGIRAGFIVGAALPITALMVFIGMQLIGFPLHQMSVTGLVIALGLLIDNAIVVVDEIDARLKQGMTVAIAIHKSARTLLVPLAASTLTTVLTFIPTVLIPGDVGEFVKGVAVSLVLALLSSWAVSLTVIPALVGWANALPLPRRAVLRRWWVGDMSWPSLTRDYRRSLDFVLHRPRLGIALALVLPLFGFLVAPALSLQLFSPVDRDQFYVELELPAQTAIAQTRSVVEAVNRQVLQSPNVTDVHWFLGKSPPEFYYNTDRWRDRQPNYAQGVVQLSTFKDSQTIIQHLQSELGRDFPQARILVRQLEQGDWFPAPVELRITGPDLATLQQLGAQARQVLAETPQIVHARDSLTGALPKLALNLNETQARIAQTSNSSIAQQLDSYLEGAVGGSVFEGKEEIPVRVRLEQRTRGNLERIETLSLLPSETLQPSAGIPLAGLGDVELVPELATITRRNLKRVNNVQGFVTAGSLPTAVLLDFRQRLKSSDFQLPPGYSMAFGGEFETILHSVQGVLPMLLPTGISIVTILVLSFNSCRLACIILGVGICAIGLSLASLWLFRYPLGFMAFLGTVGLVGIAINDSIVVLAGLRTDAQARCGDRGAVREVVVRATRHVLTTTFTTVTGFIPLLLGGGQFWPPLAVCIAGGVLGTTLLALYLVPCAYLLSQQSALNRKRFSQTLLLQQLS